MSKKRLLAFAIPFLTLAPTVAFARGTSDKPVVPATVVKGVDQGVITKLSLTFTTKAKATVKFWDKLAYCETGADWTNGGYYAGGLGIAQSTWVGYGGDEFAKSPAKATKAEQIIVANRISTQGYLVVEDRDPEWAKIHGVPIHYEFFRDSVGFNGWGALPCTGKKPKLFHYDNYKAVAKVPYSFGEKGLIVRDLQTLIGATVDGDYGAKTREAHIRFLKNRGISPDGIVPPLPKKKVSVKPASSGRVSTQSVKATASCPRYESLLKKYGLPVKQFSYIMWRESKCQALAIGWNYKKGHGVSDCKLAVASVYKNCYAVSSYDTGLLQINSTWKSVVAKVCNRPARQIIKSLTKPECNIKVAGYLYKNGGIGHWKATSGIK